jgi:hypothetical protein
MRKAHTRPTTIPAIAPPDKVDPEEESEDVDGLFEVPVVAVVWVAVEIEAVAVGAPETSTLIPRKRPPPAKASHL